MIQTDKKEQNDRDVIWTRAPEGNWFQVNLSNHFDTLPMFFGYNNDILCEFIK